MRLLALKAFTLLCVCVSLPDCLPDCLSVYLSVSRRTTPQAPLQNVENNQDEFARPPNAVAREVRACVRTSMCVCMYVYMYACMYVG